MVLFVPFEFGFLGVGFEETEGEFDESIFSVKDALLFGFFILILFSF